MTYANDGLLPVIYVRGFAGGPSGINTAVDDPFYGFNEGSVQVRVDGADRPAFHQFESPLLRLMIDQKYQLLVQGNQLAYLTDATEGSIPSASIWVHRFYDEFAPDLTKDPNAFSIERAAQSLFSLVKLVRTQTGAPRVFLVAHSMGGLIVRSMIQQTIPNDPDVGGSADAAKAFVDRVFTYATPHGGIEFSVGFGALEKLRDVTGVSGADMFGPARMREYLTWSGTPKRAPFEATEMPDDGFPKDRFFCLVGTNSADYAAAMGLSARAVGTRSDGLVQIDNAYVKDTPRALVHRSHSGRYGIVNSEEGYQNMRRFLFGDVEVRAELTDFELPGTPGDDTDWQLEASLSIRGLPVVLHEQSAAHLCPIQIERPAGPDEASNPIPLLRTYLSTQVARPANATTGQRSPTMRHVLQLRLLSLRKKGGILTFLDHLEQTADWADVLVVDIAFEQGTTPQSWAVWNSSITTAIRDWVPDPAVDPPLQDQDTSAGHWLVRVPVPPAARKLLGGRGRRDDPGVGPGDRRPGLGARRRERGVRARHPDLHAADVLGDHARRRPEPACASVAGQPRGDDSLLARVIDEHELVGRAVAVGPRVRRVRALPVDPRPPALLLEGQVGGHRDVADRFEQERRRLVRALAGRRRDRGRARQERPGQAADREQDRGGAHQRDEPTPPHPTCGLRQSGQLDHLAAGRVVDAAHRLLRRHHAQEPGHAGQLAHGGAARVAGAQVLLVRAPVLRAQRAQDEGSVPVAELVVVRAHDETPLSCSARRSARRP